MKRCEVCNKLADNGTKYCQKCGTAFKYDPKVTPFSETRIILGVLILAIVGLVISNAIPQPLPDPTQCSRTSYRRFRNIANDYYRESKNVLRAEMIMTRELSELRILKNEAEALPVPACLEPAKTALVEYLDDFYYIALFSVWGSFRASGAKMESAAGHWESLNAHLDLIDACAPNCP